MLNILVSLVVLLAACGPPVGDDHNRDQQPIAAVFSTKCGSCHGPGGPGGLVLDGETAAAARELVLGRIHDGTMPPWLPGPGSLAMLGDRSLSAADREAIEQWYAAGAQPRSWTIAGMESGRVRADIQARVASRVPVRVEEYRCFAVPISVPGFAAGWSWLVPPNQHHLAGWVFEAAAFAKLAARSGEDGRPGWSCPSSPEVPWAGTLSSVGVGLDSTFRLPTGTGLPLPTGGGLVLQIHATPGSQPEFGVDIELTQHVDRVLAEVDWVAPIEIACPGGPATSGPCSRDEAIAKSKLTPPAQLRRDSDDTLRQCGHTVAELSAHAVSTGGHYYQSTDCIKQIDISGQLVAVHPHLHTRGVSARIELSHGSGPWMTLIDVPRWRWRWEAPFFLTSPVEVKAGDRMRVSCVIDNGPDAQWGVGGELPTDYPVPGPKQSSQWRTGGVEQPQEMCAAFTTISVPRT